MHNSIKKTFVEREREISHIMRCHVPVDELPMTCHKMVDMPTGQGTCSDGTNHFLVMDCGTTLCLGRLYGLGRVGPLAKTRDGQPISWSSKGELTSPIRFFLIAFVIIKLI